MPSITPTPFVRIFSRRAPYTRGGVKFATTTQPVEFHGDDIPPADQLVRLVADPQIRVEVHDGAGSFVVAQAVNDEGALSAGPVIEPSAETSPETADAEPPARPARRRKGAD